MSYKRTSPKPVVEGGTGAQTLTGICIGNGTSAITGNAVTQYNALIGGVSNAVSSVAPSATSGVPLISQGSASNPAFGTAVVAGGGTGAVSFTAHGVLLGQGTSAIGVTAVGTTGQILTGVTGSDPVWASPATQNITITGDTGGGLTGQSFTFTGGSTGLSFGGSVSTETLSGTLVVSNGGTGRATLTTHGVLIGAGTSAITQLAAAATGSTLMGSTGADPAFTGSPSFSGSVTAGTSITATSGDLTITAGNILLANSTSSVGVIKFNGSGVFANYGSETNIFVGKTAGNSSVTGTENACLGERAGNAISSGGNNTCIGAIAGRQFTTGGNNTLIGYSAGGNYTGSESNNIILGFNVGGTAAESSITRIGVSISKCFISGIYGITTDAGGAVAVLVSPTGQLGTTSSSIRYKQNVRDMDSSLVLKLRPVNFEYKKFPGQKGYGLIAEEVEQIMPELVAYNEEGKPESVKYHDLPAILLNEIQKLRKELDELKRSINNG